MYGVSRILLTILLLACLVVVTGCRVEDTPAEQGRTTQQGGSIRDPEPPVLVPDRDKGSVYGGANGSVFRDSKVVIFLPETGELLGTTVTSQSGRFQLEKLPFGGPYILRLSGGFECSHDGRIVPLQTYLFSIVPEVMGKTRCQITPLTELMYWLARAIQGSHFMEPKSVYCAMEILRRYFGVDAVQDCASLTSNIEAVRSSIRIRAAILQLENTVIEAADDEYLLPAYEEFSQCLAFLAYDMVDGHVDGKRKAGAYEALAEDLGMPEEDVTELSYLGEARTQALAAAFARNVSNMTREEYLELLEQAARSFTSETSYTWKSEAFRADLIQELAREEYPEQANPENPDEPKDPDEDVGGSDDPDEPGGGAKPLDPKEKLLPPVKITGGWAAGELPKISLSENSGETEARTLKFTLALFNEKGMTCEVSKECLPCSFVGGQAALFSYTWGDKLTPQGEMQGEVHYTIPEAGLRPEKIGFNLKYLKDGRALVKTLEIRIEADPVSIHSLDIIGDFWEQDAPRLSLESGDLMRVQTLAGEMLQSSSPLVFGVECQLNEAVTWKSRVMSFEISSDDVTFAASPDKNFGSSFVLEGVAALGKKQVYIPCPLYVRCPVAACTDGVKSAKIQLTDEDDPTNTISKNLQLLCENSSVTGVQCLMPKLKILLGEEEQEEVKGLDVLECFGSYDIQVPLTVTETIPHSGQVDLEEWKVSLGPSSLADFGSEIELLSQELEPLPDRDSQCFLLKMKYTMGFFRIGEKEGDNVVYTPKFDSITVTLSRKGTDDDPVSFSTELVLPFLHEQKEL